jgi:DNA-binding LytR/AlgR family response regulator
MDSPITYSCVIVDDEPLARQVLEQYIASVPYLRLVQSCSTALEALSVMNRTKIDILFADVNMPELTGIQLVKLLDVPPKVILATAFETFAVQGFEIGAVDYLMKPISFERFVKAVQRAIDIPSQPNSLERERDVANENQMLFFKTDKVFHKVFVNDLRYVEAYGNFVKLHTTESTLLISDTLTSVQMLLPINRFVRVHKSFIIALTEIIRVEGNTVFLSNEEAIPIGASFRKEFVERLQDKT